MLEINKIHQGDCLELLKEIPDNSIDIVITDPPYNVINMEWDNKINWEILSEEIYRVLKVNGSIYIFGQFPMICDVYVSFNKKFKFKQDLIWYKNRGFSLANTVFTKYHENILFFVKGNEQILKQFGSIIKNRRLELNLSLKQIGELCDEKWYHRGGHMYYETGLACPTEKQYDKLIEILKLEDNFRCLFDRPVFNFEDIKLDGEPYTITRKAQKLYGKKSNLGEFKRVNNGKRNPKTVLEYSIVQSGKEYVGHPTQKPIELLKYILTASSRPEELVLDPFIGSGSTAVACKQLGRNYLGIELTEEYCEVARKRLLQNSLLPLAENSKEDGIPPNNELLGILPKEL